MNIDQFPFENIYSKEDIGQWSVKGILLRGYSKAFGEDLFWETTARQEGVDIIHSHFGTTGVVDIGLSKRLHVPHVVSFYGYDYGKVSSSDSRMRRKYQELFRTVSGIFVEGPYARNKLISLGLDPAKTFISHLGVDLSSILMKPRIWTSAEEFKILVVGSFVEKKGILIALKAIASVVDEIGVKISVTVIGDAVPGIGKESLQVKKNILALVGSRPLRGLVTLKGFLPYKDVMSLAYLHHLLIQTSIHAGDGDCEGGFPVIITDMMATGLPVLGSTHCDIPHIIRHGENGFVAAERDIKETSGMLAEIIANYNSYSRNWSQFNKQFLKDNFEARGCAMKRETLYQNMLGHAS